VAGLVGAVVFPTRAELAAWISGVKNGEFAHVT